MLSWATRAAQSGLASIAGTAEPIYGPEALQSVGKQEHYNPRNEIVPEDLQWHGLETTCAETETFYIETESGHYVMTQVIYSNVANLHVTSQVNFKVFYPDGRIHWSTMPMQNFVFENQKRNLKAENFNITLSDSSDYFSITSATDTETTLNLKITRTAPGFKIGKDGKTNFGQDPKNPWGCIKHIFWPTAKAEGTVTIKGEKLDVTGRACFIMALQGMKPHHAAAKWNFVNFQSPNLSAIMMEFTTPPSYGTQTVNVSGITKHGALLVASTHGTLNHKKVKLDNETEWNEPTALEVRWKGKDADEKVVEAELDIELKQRLDRVDIMAEVPAVIKRFVAGAVGTRPFVYQFKQKVTLKLKVGDEVTVEDGTMFAEATFVS